MRRTGRLREPRIGLVLALAAWLIASSSCSSRESANAPATSDAMNIDGPISVSWTANRERAVNAPGGGYRVYYATVAGFNVANAAFVDVPYVSGANAPTATALPLFAGTYFIKVVAYSALNPGGSAPSAEIAVTVPAAAGGALARANGG